MTSKPFFSIILPTYNRAHLIRRAIESVSKQTHSPYEVIIVDDGSTDKTSDVIAPLLSSRLRYVRKVNGERGSARNYGVNLAEGDYVSFLDSDDVLYPNHLSSAAEVLVRYPQIQAFHLGYDVKNSSGKVVRTGGRVASLAAAILKGNPLSCNGVFLSRETARQYRFSEDRSLSGLEDWELWFRLSRVTEVRCVDVITSTVIDHPERSVVKDAVYKIADKVEAFRRHIEIAPVFISPQDKGTLLSSAYAYGALHLAMAGAPRGEVLRYMYRALRHDSISLLSRRTLATGRLLLWNRSRV
jgi:glycosyltransferase involved in cell wall biosynthesis